MEKQEGGKIILETVTKKFLTFVHDKVDGYKKPLSLDQSIVLQSAQRMVENADKPDYIIAKRNQTKFAASLEGWSYNVVGAGQAEFVADAVEFLMAVGLAYCVRTAEQRVRAIWRSLPLSWQTQPIYDVLYKFKERSDENLRSNLDIAIKNCKSSPTGFLEICLKNDSGALERKKAEAAGRAALEKQLEDSNLAKVKERIDGEFAELMAEPDYEERFAACVAWYKSRYLKSANFIDNYPQAVNGYLMNMKLRGGYENFGNDNNQSAGQTADLDAALLDNE